MEIGGGGDAGGGGDQVEMQVEVEVEVVEVEGGVEALHHYRGPQASGYLEVEQLQSLRGRLEDRKKKEEYLLRKNRKYTG